MNNISEERKTYHSMIREFREMLKAPSPIIYDIGKTPKHDYASWFEGSDFKTIDINPRKNPDMLLDVESPNIMPSLKSTAHGILCNGCTEQCGNPFNLMRGVHDLLRMNGMALFGIISIGYPIFEFDRFRFTPNGAQFALENCGFRLLKTQVVERIAGTPSYFFAIVVKKGGGQ